MPNYCDYEMKVSGSKSNIDEFVSIIQADYHVDENGKCNYDRHFWRIFEADVVKEEFNSDGNGFVIIGGYCAWSVFSCMFDGEDTYNETFPNKGGTSLQAESKRLNLTIEVFSSESGCCFMEHYLFINGNCLIDDCLDYHEYYTYSFDTVEEMNERYNTNFTKEEFEENEYLCVGGIPWEYGEYID